MTWSRLYRVSLIFFASICLFPTSLRAQQEIVYDNTKTLLNMYATETTEYGDEVALGGNNRAITQFYFEYFGDFLDTADQWARIRLYKNDHVLSKYQIAPGTMLYESPWFLIRTNYNSKTLALPSVIVPDRFSYSIEFKGMSMTPGDRAGLLCADPETVGMSPYNDFWRKRQISPGLMDWRLANYSVINALGVSVPGGNNFCVQMSAVPAVPKLEIAKNNRSVSINFPTPVETYQLEESDSLAPDARWTPVPTKLVAGRNNAQADAVAPIKYYRLRQVIGRPQLKLERTNGKTVVSWPAAATGYTLEAATVVTGHTSDWTGVAHQTQGDRNVVTAPDTGYRFYRLTRAD